MYYFENRADLNVPSDMLL